MINNNKNELTLEEVVDEIVEQLISSEIELDIIKNNPFASFLHNAGMYIRNYYGLWNEYSSLRTHFKNRFGLDHPDDISGIILDCVYSKLLNKPNNTEKLVEQYKKHWEFMSNNSNCNMVLKVDNTGNVTYVKQ